MSITVTALPLPWVCGAERFQWVSPAHASVGRSPPAWWPFVLEAVAEKRWKMVQTIGFGGNPEQIQGWSAWTQQLLKACFCTDAELFANGVLWKWDLKEPWVFHGSERNLQKQKENTYLELLWTALHPMHRCINSLVPCFIRHLE